MKNIFLSIVVVFLSMLTYAQENMDSLWSIWNDNSQPDSTRLLAMKDISWEYAFFNPDSSVILAQQGVDLSREKGLKIWEGKLLNNQGVANYVKGDLAMAQDYYHKSLYIKEELGDVKGMASSLNNIAIIYDIQGKYDKALEYFKKSIVLKEQQGRFGSAAKTKSNIGVVYFKMEEFDSAKVYAFQSLAVEDENYYHGMAASLDNIGNIYFREGDLDSAYYYYAEGLKYEEQDQNLQGMSGSLTHLANIDHANGKSSLKNCQLAYDYAIQINALAEIGTACNCLYQSYKIENDYQSAVKYLELSQAYTDSVNNEESDYNMIQNEFEYQYERKLEKDSILIAGQEKQNEISNTIIEANKIKAQNDDLIKISLFGGVGFLIFIVSALFVANRNKSKANRIIKLEKEKVTHKNEIIKEQHKEINDSINYAKLIQDATFPEKSMLDVFPNSFILLKPKDKVSGDFYWIEENKEYSFLAVADSTGHGIPGAFISLIGTILLNEIYNSKNIYKPNLVLDELNRLVQLTLEQHKEDARLKDGMDVAFCCFDKQKQILHYAGANNPLWLLRKSNFIEANIVGKDIRLEPNVIHADINLFELKADKRPIGKTYGKEIDFRLTSIKVEKGDTIYMSSDGYADQFGGERGKKLKYKPFKKILCEINSNPVNLNGDILGQKFEEWKGFLEQIDDVCVVGVRL